VNRASVVASARLLREAEKRVTRLERQRDKILESLTAALGYQEMTSLGADLAAVQTELEKSEDAWLLLAEEAGSGN